MTKKDWFLIPNIEPVKCVQDDSSHWYIIPVNVSDQFYIDMNDESIVDSGEFDKRYRKYRTGGDLNRVQLYAEIKPNQP